MPKNRISYGLGILLLGCPLPKPEPCLLDDELGESTEDLVCEVPPEISVNGGYVECAGVADETLEHLSDTQAVSFGMMDYWKDDEKGYSYVAIVDGREPGPVNATDYRAFVEAVVSYEDPVLGARMGMMGRACCPALGWYQEYPWDFGSYASPQCQDPFGTGDYYPSAYCLPMPDARWPSNNVPDGDVVPITGGLCVYFCNSDLDCPGYGEGLHYCDIPTFAGEVIDVPIQEANVAGVCRNVNYPGIPTPLVDDQPIHVHLTKDISP